MPQQSLYVRCRWLPRSRLIDAVHVGHLLSGLLMRRLRLLALMKSANKVPFCCAGYDALDMSWVVPVPGLTGLPSLASRSQPREADLLLS